MKRAVHVPQKQRAGGIEILAAALLLLLVLAALVP